MIGLDHLVVSAGTLDEGVAAVEAALGVALAGGGKHDRMGTHNRLLGLGDIYLEVIAVDPGAPAPAWPRWFDLDRFTGRPRLTNWVARCGDVATELALSPPGTGEPMEMSRGPYRWDYTVPADGRLPFDGGFPALLHWKGGRKPPDDLPEAGVRLERLEIAHPEAGALRAALAGRIEDSRLAVVAGTAVAMRASFRTPAGLRVLE